MPYWMTNPMHGVMPAYNLSEVEQAKVHGWTLLNEGPAPERAVIGKFAPAAAIGKPVDEVQFYEAPFVPPIVVAPMERKKPGRPAKAK